MSTGDRNSFWERLKLGDEGAWAEAIEVYTPQLLRTAKYRMNDFQLAEDMVQETWLAAFVNVKPASFECQDKFLAWLRVILRNKIIGFKRKCSNKREITTEHGDVPQLAASQTSHRHEKETTPKKELPQPRPSESLPYPTPEQEAIRKEEAQIIRLCVEKLPDEYGEVIELFCFEGLSYAEIEGRLSISHGSLKNRLHRARMELARCLERNNLFL